MLRWLFLPPVALISALSALTATTIPGRILAALIALASIRVLFRTKRPRKASSTTPPAPLWHPSPPRRPPPPARTVQEQAEARVGEPLHAICFFELHAQDRPGERWQGTQPLWIALGEQTIWFLHDATLGRLGGVWDALPRQGLHTLTHEHPNHHDVELSWPHRARLIIGDLQGPTDQRRRLLGLLAADELGVRDILDQPRHNQ